MVKTSKGISEDDSNLLVVILDTNPFVWENHKDELSFDIALAQVLVFINAHLALQHNNQVAVIASHVGSSAILYPPSDSSFDLNDRHAKMYRSFQIVDDAVTLGISKLFQNTESAKIAHEKTTTKMAGALSISLAYINRILKTDDRSRIRPRIIILSVSRDSSFQYIPIMNCIFSAQKMGIPIDICSLFGKEPVFLQQAAHITGGIYLCLNEPKGLLKYLMTVHLPDRFVREYLYLPSEDQVDFRAACFCHRKIIDVGYVCSVCLSIFCSPIAVCTTCLTKFPIKTLTAYGPRRRPAPPKRSLISRSSTPAPSPGPSTPPQSQ